MVGGLGDVAIVIEVAHALVHGKPAHLLLTMPGAGAAHAELPRLVDDRLDAKDQAELVVHFQPVVLHAMFNACPRPAFFLTVVEHLALEAWIELAAQEGKNIGGRELQGGVVEQALVQRRERGAATKEDVRAELGLIDNPVIAGAFQPGLAGEQRIDDCGPALEDFGPR